MVSSSSTNLDWGVCLRLVSEFLLYREPPTICLIADEKAILFLHSDEDADQLATSGSKGLGRLSWFFQRWSPTVGRVKRGDLAKKWWLRIVGLPHHLWNREIFTAIKGLCGGLLR